MSNTTNSPILTYTGLDSFPLSSALTGTFTSVASTTTVNGAGTLLTTEIPNQSDSYGYLWDTASGDWRKITEILSPTLCTIDTPFTTNGAGRTMKWIPQTRAREVGYSDIAGGGGTIDGVTLVAGEGGSWGNIDISEPPIAPHIINGTNGAIRLTATY